MGGFFKMFFASLLAMIIFSLLVFFILFAWVAGVAKSDRPVIAENAVLVLNLSVPFQEQQTESPLAEFSSNDELKVPGLYDVVRLIRTAASDEKIKGLYMTTGWNPNGFANCEAIRNAIVEFRKSGKFVIAYGEMMDQKSYHVANAADKVYVNPKGYFEWLGLHTEILFLKGTLEKLNIEPQIFYAGKFKSATEPFRTEKMTEENRLQTSGWLADLYAHFLVKASETRNMDTALLHQLANDGSIQNPEQAAEFKLIDGTRYDDEIKDEIKQKLGIEQEAKINFVTINRYFKAAAYKKTTGDRIALIFAEGDIIDGNGEEGQIGSAEYMKLFRKARLDNNIRAVVLRVNSGGGSALASENIWREVALTQQEKPVVVSFGNLAASGGYYISCAADSIFAEPNTLTGSIGVFGILPNMQGFFKNKLGITFDGVKTSPYADVGTVVRPLTDNEKKFIQNGVDQVYATFKQRVSEGRKKSVDFIDSIGQGRVWSGTKAIEVGLIDRFGGIQDAVDCAARMAKLTDYKVKEYPEIRNIFDRIFGASDPAVHSTIMKKELGAEHYKIFQEMKRVQQMTGQVQARLPFQFIIN